MEAFVGVTLLTLGAQFSAVILMFTYLYYSYYLIWFSQESCELKYHISATWEMRRLRDEKARGVWSASVSGLPQLVPAVISQVSWLESSSPSHLLSPWFIRIPCNCVSYTEHRLPPPAPPPMDAEVWVRQRITSLVLYPFIQIMQPEPAMALL